MTIKKQLVHEAAGLPLPDPEATPAFKEIAPALTRRMEAEFFARPDVPELIGPDNREMVRNNHANHVRYLASLLTAFDPASFVEIVHWVYRTYRAHGVSTQYWEIALPLWRKALELEAPERVLDVMEPV